MKFSNGSFLSSLGVALRGIGFSFALGRNFRFQLFFFLLVFFAGVYFRITFLEWMLILNAGFLVLAAELFNTAIELSIDLTTRRHRLRAMMSKDIAAAAVLLCSVYAVIIGAFIFFPKVWVLFR